MNDATARTVRGDSFGTACLVKGAPVKNTPMRAMLFAALASALFFSSGAVAVDSGISPQSSSNQRMQDVSADDVFTDRAVARLAAAAASGDVDQVHRIAAGGADVNAHGDKGVTPLLWAIVHRSTRGIAALMSVGAQASAVDMQGITAMHLAAGADDPALLDALLSNGASPDIRDPVRGRTPIFVAILGDRQSQFEQLLSVADLDAADKLGNRPLHTAASIGDYARVLQLLQSSASPAAENALGDTFLQMLPQGGRLSSVASAQARQSRMDLVAWLQSHGIALVTGLQAAD